MKVKTFTSFRKRATTILFALITNFAFAQASIYTTPYVVDPAKNPGFNTSLYESWTYQRTVNGAIQKLPFRMMKPVAYSKLATPYPLIIMLHGHGEHGTDNNFQLKWGGIEHQNAVQANKFKGFVVFPQEPFGSWANTAVYGPGQATTALLQVWDLVDSLLYKYNIDPDRVIIHGLSAGGTGTWASLYNRPDLFAAALPMSTPGDLTQVSKVAVTPIWLFQGEIDTNPVASISHDMMNALHAEGALNANLTKYTEYPGVGHNVWSYAYADPNFFPYILAQNKKNIMLLGTNPLPMFGGSVSMGIASGMSGYQWYKDGVAIVGATSYRLNGATQTGTYTVSFKRKPNSRVWSVSNPLVIKRKSFIIIYPFRTEDANDQDVSLSIFPNPTSGLTTVTLPGEISAGTLVTVTNQLGMTVYIKELTENVSQLDLSALPRGTYIANISDGSRKDNIKLIIE